MIMYGLIEDLRSFSSGAFFSVKSARLMNILGEPPPTSTTSSSKNVMALVTQLLTEAEKSCKTTRIGVPQQSWTDIFFTCFVRAPYFLPASCSIVFSGASPVFLISEMSRRKFESLDSTALFLLLYNSFTTAAGALVRARPTPSL